MGENECLGWFPRYTPSKPMCDDVGCTANVPTIEYVGIDTSGKPIYKPNTSCGTIPKLSSADSQRFASAKAEMDAMAEKYKPIVDELMREIHESSQKSIELFSEDTAKGESDAKFLTPPNCEALKRVVDEMKEKILADLSIKPHKARKHYKPKFTL